MLGPHGVLENYSLPRGNSMADNKRYNAGVRASSQGTSGAAGQGMAGAMVPLEVALSGAIGAR